MIVAWCILIVVGLVINTLYCAYSIGDLKDQLEDTRLEVNHFKNALHQTKHDLQSQIKALKDERALAGERFHTLRRRVNRLESK